MGRLRLFTVVAVWLLLGCQSQQLRCSGCSTSSNSTTRKTTPAVLFPSATTKSLKVTVDLACKREEHAKGLMYVRKLAENHGMLFVFDVEKLHSFWMKNTYIPLDMIHINKNNEIVGIVENAQPHDLNSRSVGRKATYVLEVNAFYARKHGIEIGQKVTFAGTPFCKSAS
jgi:uncharacterized membrane protein (UPF0127 family)